MQALEPLQELYKRSQLLILDFDQIPENTPNDESMRHYFEVSEQKGINPRLPENRQVFNNQLLRKTGKRYLVSGYGEDRRAMLTGSSIASEYRTIHLGVDIFCKNLEPVYAPYSATIKRVGREPEDHSFGYYLILKPDKSNSDYIFFGHLSGNELPAKGSRVLAGQKIARVGDFTTGENGDWSRHLHVQVLKELPPAGEAPIGYSSIDDFLDNCKNFPDPMGLFPEWELQ